MTAKRTSKQLDSEINAALLRARLKSARRHSTIIKGGNQELRRTTIQQQMEPLRTGGRIRTVEVITEAPAAKIEALHAAEVNLARLPFYARKAAEA